MRLTGPHVEQRYERSSTRPQRQECGQELRGCRR
jgi:hypothetical protein